MHQSLSPASYMHQSLTCINPLAGISSFAGFEFQFLASCILQPTSYILHSTSVFRVSGIFILLPASYILASCPSFVFRPLSLLHFAFGSLPPASCILYPASFRCLFVVPHPVPCILHPSSLPASHCCMLHPASRRDSMVSIFMTKIHRRTQGGEMQDSVTKLGLKLFI